MSLTDLTGHILKEAELHREDILSRANKDIEVLRQETAKKKEGLLAKEERDIDAKITEIEKRALAEAGRIKNLYTEKAKREILDDIFLQAEKKINNLATEEYIKFFKYWLTKILPLKEGELLFPANKEAESKEIIKDLKLDYLTTKATNNMVAGFIFKTENFEADLTPGKIIAGQKDSLESLIASKIFS